MILGNVIIVIVITVVRQINVQLLQWSHNSSKHAESSLFNSCHGKHTSYRRIMHKALTNIEFPSLAYETSNKVILLHYNIHAAHDLYL